MLEPKKLKFRKWHKGRRGRKGRASSGTKLSFGSAGLKSLDHGKLTAQQIEAMRKVVVRYTNRGGKLWLRVYPQKPLTKKGVEVKMGGGVGDIDKYAATVKPGHVIVEVDGVDPEIVEKMLRESGHKLSVRTKIIKREEV